MRKKFFHSATHLFAPHSVCAALALALATTSIGTTSKKPNNKWRYSRFFSVGAIRLRLWYASEMIMMLIVEWWRRLSTRVVRVSTVYTSAQWMTKWRFHAENGHRLNLNVLMLWRFMQIFNFFYFECVVTGTFRAPRRAAETVGAMTWHFLFTHHFFIRHEIFQYFRICPTLLSRPNVNNI